MPRPKPRLPFFVLQRLMVDLRAEARRHPTSEIWDTARALQPYTKAYRTRPELMLRALRPVLGVPHSKEETFCIDQVQLPAHIRTFLDTKVYRPHVLWRDELCRRAGRARQTGLWRDVSNARLSTLFALRVVPVEVAMPADQRTLSYLRNAIKQVLNRTQRHTKLCFVARFMNQNYGVVVVSTIRPHTFVEGAVLRYDEQNLEELQRLATRLAPNMDRYWFHTVPVNTLHLGEASFAAELVYGRVRYRRSMSRYLKLYGRALSANAPAPAVAAPEDPRNSVEQLNADSAPQQPSNSSLGLSRNALPFGISPAAVSANFFGTQPDGIPSQNGRSFGASSSTGASGEPLEIFDSPQPPAGSKAARPPAPRPVPNPAQTSGAAPAGRPSIRKELELLETLSSDQPDVQPNAKPYFPLNFPPKSRSKSQSKSQRKSQPKSGPALTTMRSRGSTVDDWPIAEELPDVTRGPLGDYDYAYRGLLDGW